MTPGPWFVEAGGARLINTNVHVVSANDGLGPVAYSTKENAALVSAAPDLLRVAELVVSWLDEEPGAHALCDTAREAIAKATQGA